MLLPPASIGVPAIREDKVHLAPMTGVTDLPFRRLVRRLGGGIAFSEMIAGKELLRRSSQSMRMALLDENEPVKAVQIAGREPALMADAARLAVDLGADLVDINMGCPVKKVVNGLGGSALLRDEPLAGRILDAVVHAVDVPVTLKTRLGWDQASRNAPRIARLAHAAGIARITVHGRTREQMYEGSADWAAVRAVGDAVPLPLVVNGDIGSVAAARQAMALSGAEAVMVGRAACGRPWLIGTLRAAIERGEATHSPSPEAQRDIVLGHYDDMLSFYGKARGARIARKHLGWYVEAWPGGHEHAARIRALDDTTAVRLALRNFYDGLADQLVLVA